MTAEFLVGKLAMGSPFLVTLLSSTDPRIQENAVTALLNISIFKNNNILIIAALLIELLLDDKAGITDDALMVLALLLGCPEGLEAIKKSQVLIPLLIDLLRSGSAKGKDNFITLLLGLCKDGGTEVSQRLLINHEVCLLFRACLLMGR